MPELSSGLYQVAYGKRRVGNLRVGVCTHSAWARGTCSSRPFRTEPSFQTAPGNAEGLTPTGRSLARNDERRDSAIVRAKEYTTYS